MYVCERINDNVLNLFASNSNGQCVLNTFLVLEALHAFSHLILTLSL